MSEARKFIAGQLESHAGRRKVWAAIEVRLVREHHAIRDGLPRGNLRLEDLAHQIERNGGMATRPALETGIASRNDLLRSRADLGRDRGRG